MGIAWLGWQFSSAPSSPRAMAAAKRTTDNGPLTSPYLLSPRANPRQAAAMAARSAGVTSESFTLSGTILASSGVSSLS